jgi:hypothetical protein
VQGEGAQRNLKLMTLNYIYKRNVVEMGAGKGDRIMNAEF